MKLCEIQHAQGLYFLHEHPSGASSWKDPYVIGVEKLAGVRKIKSNMCAFGMWQEDKEGPGLVKKPTTFMTNSAGIAERLERNCAGDHRHIVLVGGNRAHRAETYPDELCREIVLGLADQMKRDGRISDTCMGCLCAMDEHKEVIRELVF